MPCIQKNKLENGFISYRIQVKAKNDRTGKFEAKVMTWRKPPEINEKQCQRELQRIAYEFEDKFRKQLNGLLAIDNDITFMEFANKWLEQVKQTKSLNYYLKGRDALKKFEEFFGNKKLKDISPIDVQSFLDTMQSRQVEMKRAFLKKDLLQYVKSHCIDITNTLPKYEISRSVYHYATAGHGIRIANAHKICEALKIDFDEYFRIDIDRHHYAKETLQKLKRTLATILATAKRQRLVEHNFASRDYITPIQGYKKEVQILNDKEAIEFVKYLHEANLDPKWKASMLISIYMGTRRGETAGLEWKDIDFENKTMKIQRSVQDIVGFGIITKEPKTETSKRTITMPDRLVEDLKEYKVWWDEHKNYMGDLWANTDRLFFNDEGQTICPGLLRVWLQKILARAGLPCVTLHSLRHTNITMQLKAGVDMKTVSTRAGHSKASTTSDFYSHFLKNSDIVASEKLNEILG